MLLDLYARQKLVLGGYSNHYVPEQIVLVLVVLKPI